MPAGGTIDPLDDPTRNVLDLVAAAIQRQDDLRTSEANHIREINALREGYQLKLRVAESERIDAIRAVDVAAVQRAAETSATQANTLAGQVATSAETLRTQVATTATAATVSLAAALQPIQTDIADLRKAQYEAQGQKTQVVETRSHGASTGMWIGIAASIGFGFLSITVTIIAIATTVLIAMR